MVLGKRGIGYGGRNSLRQRTTPCFCRSRVDNIRVTGARPFSVNNRSGPYYRTGHRKSVKIRNNSYGWQLWNIGMVASEPRPSPLRIYVYRRVINCAWVNTLKAGKAWANTSREGRRWVDAGSRAG